MSVNAEMIADGMDDEERLALAAIVAIFGEDTNTILNALMVMACKVAIYTDVTPKCFAANMKSTWDGMAEAINSAVN